MENERIKKWVNDYLENYIEFLNSKKVKNLLKDYTYYMVKNMEDYIIDQLQYSTDDVDDIDNVEETEKVDV